MSAFSSQDDFVARVLHAGQVIHAELDRRVHAKGYTGLRPSDHVLLEYLAYEPLSLGALAARLRVTPQSAQFAYTRLIDIGYVVNERDPTDRRRRILGLTDRGRRLVSDEAEWRRGIEQSVRERVGDSVVDQTRDAHSVVVELFGGGAPVRRRRRPALRPTPE